MEDQAKEINIEKVDLEKGEIAPDSKITIEKRENHQNEQISQENEDNNEVIGNNEINAEQNIEEINEEEENVNEEEAYNEEGGENQEIHVEDVENQEIQDEENNNEEAIIEEKGEDENKINMDSMDAENEGQNVEEQNEEEEEENQEEEEENQEEEENNEEEELQQNEQEQEEQQEYKERQAIHIHREEQEKEEYNEEENENLEDSGKIHPIHSIDNNVNNINKESQEEKIEYINREEEENETEQNQLKKDEEIQTKIENILYPKDSKPKLDIQEINPTKNITQNTQIIKKENKKGPIPRIMIFQKKSKSQVQEQEQLQEKEAIKTNINIETHKYEGFVEIPKSEVHKYKNEEIIVIQKNGIESGVYEFTGENKEIKIEQPGFAKAEITQEEILKEINRRRKKQKKTSYEVIDKFYTLTLYKERYTSFNNEKNTYINKVNIEKGKEECNVEMNINTELSKGTLPEDNYSKYILEQVNKIRTDPQSFIGIIEDAKDNIKQTRHGRYYYNCKNIKIGLKEGEAIFNEAIEFLKNCKPMNPLTYSDSLNPTLPKNEEELIDGNYLRMNVEKMINSGIRIKSYWRDVIKDPEVSFLLMIVDDNGQKKGMKRNDILNPYIKYIGISSVEINENFVSYFLLSS